MFILKNNYYLYIENIKLLNLNLIKKRGKFNIIYRNNQKDDSFEKLRIFRNTCKRKSIKFFIANDIKLFQKVNADGLYISSYNKSLKYLNYKTNKIGSAHNVREINTKILQGCREIVFSRLFKTDYKNKRSYLGVVKFNLVAYLHGSSFVPLGGIRLNNLNKLKEVNASSFVLMTEIKKKPAVISRLF